MKKIAILTLLLLLATGAYAQIQMSAGGGFFTDMSFFNGYKVDDVNVGWRNIGSSVFVFFDAEYAELGAGFGYGMMSRVVKRSDTPVTDIPDFGDLYMLDLSLLLKYPFKFEAASLFPLAGISYKGVLFGKIPGTKHLPYDNNKFNQFGFLAGLGFDHNFGNTMYFRIEGLFHFRFPMDFVDENLPSDAHITNGVGGRIKVGLGYRF